MEVDHLIYAQENSPAGKLYNALTLEYIRNVVKVAKDLQPIHLFKAMSDYLRIHLSEYLDVTYKEESQKS